MTSQTSPMKIGVLLSGSGTNLQAIIDVIAKEDLPIEIVHVVSSRPDAYGITRAEEAGIPVTVLNRDVYADTLAATDCGRDADGRRGIHRDGGLYAQVDTCCAGCFP